MLHLAATYIMYIQSFMSTALWIILWEKKFKFFEERGM